MSVTASLQGTLQLTDNLAGDTAMSKVISLVYTGTYSGFVQNQNLSNALTTLTLPGSPAQFVYIKNLSTVSGQNVTVTWTPNGGSSNSVAVLSPGAALILAETDTTNGITTLAVTAAVTATPIEYLICA